MQVSQGQILGSLGTSIHIEWPSAFTAMSDACKVVLLNVVVAVLLDEFITSMREEEEELAAEERQLRELGRYRGVLDPVTASLCVFEDKSHLCHQIAPPSSRHTQRV